MTRGTIVITKFPFTDLTSAKRRPALIISNPSIEKEDVIVAFISSRVSMHTEETDLFVNKGSQGFAASGLKLSSVIRLGKIATLKKQIFVGEIGALNDSVMYEVNKKLRLALCLQ